MHLISYIKTNTQLPETSIKNTVDLLNEDCTIPFISRYRKERTGNLDEVQIGEIVKYKELFETLEKRKIAILKAIEEQDALTELKGGIRDEVTEFNRDIYKMEYLEKMAEDHRINAEINDLSVIAEDGEETGDGLDYM